MLPSLIAGGIIGYFTPHPRGRPITVITPEPTATPTPTPAPLRVYGTGAVQAPDVYLLSAGSLVKDAVLAAGGPAPDADLDRINLARQLEDQQQIYVPRRGGDLYPGGIPGVSSTRRRRGNACAA
ncbi:MAG: SLBB domain-containing protein [Anaerolineae bacterium]